MKITKRQLRRIIREEKQKVLKEMDLILNRGNAYDGFKASLKENQHRCMDGTMVPAESEACHTDLVNRIEDASFHRDSHTCGTENRIYYNGLLKGLRKTRNRLQKSLYSDV